MGIAAFGTILAKTTMAEQGKFLLADALACQDSRQNQIQNGDAMM